MSGLLQGQFPSIYFVALKEPYFTVSLYACDIFLNWTFESFNVLTREVIFFVPQNLLGYFTC